ncbi:MAG: WYL domain-containing protein [Candidatus Thiodiazotropha sp. LLP2]
MTEISVHADRRLAIIDLYLAFTGQVQRSDLIHHFDIGTATASRSLKKYRSQYPDNIDYSVSDRAYISSPGFSPAYQHETDAALRLIAFGQETTQINSPRYGISSPVTLTASIDLHSAQTITSAIVSGALVSMAYSSSSSGNRERMVAPHAIFESGGTWYFRCHDLDNRDFRTFRFSRVKSAKAVDASMHKPSLGPTDDREWLSVITLTVGPHPNRENQDALRKDLGLVDKPVKNIQVNEAMAGFVLIDLRVDCSKDGNLNPHEYYLRLLNRHELVSVGSLAIAPGFSEHKKYLND